MPNKTDGIRKFFSGLNRSEPYLFFVVVLLNAWPLFTCKFFLTQDGPSHIYNSVLLRELIFGNDLSIHHVFSLNHELVPNMISHMLMATASCFLPAWMAEKIVLLIYFIGLPYVFRFFLSKSSAPEIFLSALIIPFTYSYFFYLGFYNFLLALIPFFMVLTIWTSANKKINLRFILKFFLWLMLLYFSHLYVFVLALLLMGLHTCLEFRRD